MRTTVTIDDDLVGKAEKYTGIKERSALLRAALTALIERKSLPDLRGDRRHVGLCRSFDRGSGGRHRLLESAAGRIRGRERVEDGGLLPTDRSRTFGQPDRFTGIAHGCVR